MWEKPSNFDELRAVYLEAKGRDNLQLAGIKALRDYSPMTLSEAKNLMYWIEEDCDIVEAQGRLFGDLEESDLDVESQTQIE